MRKTLLLFVGLFLMIEGFSQRLLEETISELTIMDASRSSSGYIEVPENWDTPTKMIKVAYAKINARNNTGKTVVFLQGGPGGSSTRGVNNWANHPLVENNNLILVDPRGTGFSLPNLCPELGQDFLKIMERNLSAKGEVEQKLEAAGACKKDILARGINLEGYNSRQLAHDLHFLKEALGLKTWSLYSLSYGTRVAFEYMNLFPDDIDRVVMDSPIPPGVGYYDNLPLNFQQSLSMIFKKCKNDKDCTARYGNIEEKFYRMVKRLETEPIQTQRGFVINKQDLLSAFRQGFYDRKFYEAAPMLIHEFDKPNLQMIDALVDALAGSLYLDFGVLYAMLCQETIPNNSLDTYRKNVQFENANLNVAYYEADYVICKDWFAQSVTSLPDTSKSNIPTIILAGDLDPVAPPSFSKQMSNLLAQSQQVVFENNGHASSFSNDGKQMVTDFLSGKEISKEKVAFKMPLLNNITPYAPVYAFANNGEDRNLLFIIPLALFILYGLYFFLARGFSLLRNKIESKERKTFTALAWLQNFSFLAFIVILTLGILKTVERNYYGIAVGILDQYAILKYVPWIFLLLSILLLAYWGMKRRTINFQKMDGFHLMVTILLLICAGYLGIFF